MTKEEVEQQYQNALDVLRDVETIALDRKEVFSVHLERINGLRFLASQLQKLRELQSESAIESGTDSTQEESD